MSVSELYLNSDKIEIPVDIFSRYWAQVTINIKNQRNYGGNLKIYWTGSTNIVSQIAAGNLIRNITLNDSTPSNYTIHLNKSNSLIDWSSHQAGSTIEQRLGIIIQADLYGDLTCSGSFFVESLSLPE